jgi:hypothetical protein
MYLAYNHGEVFFIRLFPEKRKSGTAHKGQSTQGK